MSGKKNTINKKQPVAIYFNLFIAVWSLLIVGAVIWSYKSIYSDTFILAKQQARIGFQKDVLIRSWAATHGGVYVSPTDKTPPNPYLSNIPDRDVTTTSGKKLTLMNPAYITRQLHELAFKKNGIWGHITSLNPIRKQNEPDSWEVSALKAFENGDKEFYGFDTINKQEYFRYMGALITEKKCMKCHATQGYKVGQIRGGISSSILWQPYADSINKHMSETVVILGILWLIGFFSLLYVKHNFVVYFEKQKEYEGELKKINEDLFYSKELVEDSLYERNKLVEEISEMNLTLEKLNMEKDRFFSIIAHDLRSPFNGLIGLTELIVSDADEFSKDELVELNKEIHISSTRLGKLLMNLLDWSQMQSGIINFTPAKCNLLECVLQNLSLFEQLIKQKEISLEQIIEKNLFVYADENMLNTIIRNFISNAVKYTPPEGNIVLIAEKNKEDEVLFSIKDSGIGIPPELMDKLFKIEEKSSRPGTNNEQGTGLGLILCKDFVERHGGRIWGKSKEGKGTTFYFTLSLFKSIR